MNEDLVKLAERIARSVHEGQTRRDGSPYIEHPRRVAEWLNRPEEKAIAWLHDVLEDTHLTSDGLIRTGIPHSIVFAVEALTKKEGEPYLDFIQRIYEYGGYAVRVKIADILDNLSDDPTAKQIQKYAKALKALLQ